MVELRICKVMEMMLKEGLPNIVARHARVGKAAREGIKSLSVEVARGGSLECLCCLVIYYK